MTDLDTVMWSLDHDHRLSNVIVGVGFLAPALDPERARRRVDRTSRVIPRLRQRVSVPPGPVPPWWEFDSRFDLDNHFSVSGPAEMTRTDVMAAATALAAEGFKPHQPLWHVRLFPHVEGDQSAFVMLAHHSIADGLGALAIQAELFDFEAAAGPQPMPDEPVGEANAILDLFGASARNEVEHGRNLLRRAARVLRNSASNPSEACDRGISSLGSLARAGLSSSEPLSPLMTERAYDMNLGGFSVPFEPAKAAAERASVKLNDFFVTAVCAGIYDYHIRHGQPVERLRMGMPLNVRPANDDASGNHIAALRLEVPLDSGTPLQQMQIMRALISNARNEEALDLMGPLYGVVSRLPTRILASTFASVVTGTDFLASNVPGVPVPVFFEGSRLIEQYPFGPLSTAAANITLLSYDNNLHLGVATDSAAVPDPEIFAASLRQGFASIAAIE